VTATARWLCLAAWTLACVLQLYYTVQTQDNVLLGNVDVTHSVRVGQAYSFAWHLFGLLSATAAFFIRGKWRVVLLLISPLLYLVVWYAHGSVRRLGFVSGYRMNWYGASLLHYEVGFFIRDVILPIAFVAVVGLTACQFFIRAAPKEMHG
jgi:hypothetical protein